METPRNKISIQTNQTELLESADALYEICDAEFNSDKTIHALINKAFNSSRTNTVEAISKSLYNHVQLAAKRNELLGGLTQAIKSDVAIAVCMRLATDWDKYLKAEQRHERNRLNDNSGPSI
jgi:hypothetical protein